MKYLVVQAHKSAPGLSVVRTMSAGDVKPPFEVWTILDGHQMDFVLRTMPNLLKKSYMYGTFETEAIYAVAYEDLALQMRKYMGPSDRDRCVVQEALYQQAKFEVEQRPEEPESAYEWRPWAKVFGLGSLFVLNVLWHTLKFCVKMVVIVFIIAFIGKRR